MRIRQYVAAGYSLAPVAASGKNPLRSGWQRERLPLAELEHIFESQPYNIGALLGQPSGSIVDVDIDCLEALPIASDFLPITDAVFGRESKTRSHWHYKATLKTEPFRDPTRPKDADGAMLVELRSTGVQTVMPGSTHSSGEPIEWAEWDGQGVPEAAEVDPAALRRSVALLATTALLGRYYPPKGVRHEFELALAGGLLRAGVTADEAIKVIDGIAKAHGIEVDGSAPATVSSTLVKLAEGEAVTGRPTVIRVLGEHPGKALVEQIGKWLGFDTSEHQPESAIWHLHVHESGLRRWGPIV